MGLLERLGLGTRRTDGSHKLSRADRRAERTVSEEAQFLRKTMRELMAATPGMTPAQAFPLARSSLLAEIKKRSGPEAFLFPYKAPKGPFTNCFPPDQSPRAQREGLDAILAAEQRLVEWGWPTDEASIERAYTETLMESLGASGHSTEDVGFAPPVAPGRRGTPERGSDGWS